MNKHTSRSAFATPTTSSPSGTSSPADATANHKKQRRRGRFGYVIAYAEKQTPEELRQQLFESGVIDADGKLTEAYQTPDRFSLLADKFIRRVKKANIVAGTEVTLVYRCKDEAGNDVPPFQIPIAPLTKVQMPDNQTVAKEFASSLHLETILQNINSLVRNIPKQPALIRGGPQFPVIVKGISLEIQQAASC